MTILAGRPKAGKSWLALQLALAIASGTCFLGCDVISGKVIYLALEDNASRLKIRMNLQQWDAGMGVTFCTDIDRSRDPNGLYHIQTLVKDHKPALLIIDTASRMLTDVKNNDLTNMTNALGPLQQLALQEECAILVIDHLRKGDDSSNGTDQVVGSVAKTAVADAIWILDRNNTEIDGVLSITGRDFEEREIPVTFDKARFIWRTRIIMLTEAQSQVLDCLKELGGRATPSDIARKIGINNGMRSLKDASNVRKALRELYDAGHIEGIENEGRNRYYVLKQEEEIPDFFEDDEAA